MKNVPNLRFPEFIELYKTHSFKDIFLFSIGKNIKQKEASPEFETPCVRYGELYHLYNEVITEVVNKTNLDKSELMFSNGDEILLPSAGEDPLDIGSASALTVKNVAIGRTINILRPLKDNVYSQRYVSYYINQKLREKISTLAKGVSISNVYNSDLKTLEIILPTLSEQEKIASFLSLINDRIQTQNKIIKEFNALKASVGKRIFSQQFRFKDDCGNEFPEWEEICLENVCEIKKGEQLNKEELDEIGLYPCLNGGISPSGFSEKYNTDENTITISEGGNSCGFVNFMTTKFWLGGHCYKILLSRNISLIYFYQLLKFNEQYIMNLRVGSGLPNIQMKSLKRFTIKISSSDYEQTKIANFLLSIDSKIDIESRLLRKLEEQKKFLLQQMFV